jgi:molybdate transport system substrate-binding protein
MPLTIKQAHPLFVGEIDGVDTRPRTADAAHDGRRRCSHRRPADGLRAGNEMSAAARLLVIAFAVIGGFLSDQARAADIAVIAPGATRSLMQELAPMFEKSSGQHLSLSYGTAGEVQRRLEAGEVFDVALLTKPRIETLQAAGTIVAGSVAVIGGSPIALAVRQGAAKPDIRSVEAFKHAVLTAKSVAYTDPASGGTSGIHMETVFRRLGIAEQVARKAKLVTGQPGAPPAVGEAIARGEAELGLQPVSELMGIRGIEIVGLIPADLQTPDLTYAAGLVTEGKQRQAGQALIGFLVGPTAAAVVKAKGMIPGNAP